MKKKKKSLNLVIGFILLGVGTLIVIPPPDIDFIILTGLTIAKVPLRYSIPIVYIGGFLLALVGSWLVGKNLIDILRFKKLNKKEIKYKKNNEKQINKNKRLAGLSKKGIKEADIAIKNAKKEILEAEKATHLAAESCESTEEAEIKVKECKI